MSKKPVTKRRTFYTFVSQGTGYKFDIDKHCVDPRVTDRSRNMLEAMKEEVKFRNSRDVFILDDEGKVVQV
jgi:hypothetical protein